MTEAEIREKQAQILEEAAGDLSWLGAQGNLVQPDTAWAGVQACIAGLRQKATNLREVGRDLAPPPDLRCEKPLMDGRNEIRCWLKEHHEGQCR